MDATPLPTQPATAAEFVTAQEWYNLMHTTPDEAQFISDFEPTPADELANPRQVSRREARTLAKLCCADCWRPITATFRFNPATRQNEDFVTCGTPLCPMHGFVSPRFVKTREQISHSEYLIARAALRELLPVRATSEAELLRGLGI